MLTLKVQNQTLSLEQGPRVVADSQGYLQAGFTFSDDWADTVKVALFYRSTPTMMFYPLLLDEHDQCLVPWEILDDEGKFTTTVFGSNHENQPNKLITTNPLEITVYESGLVDGELPYAPTIGVEGSTLAMIEATRQDAIRLQAAAQANERNAATARSAAEQAANTVVQKAEQVQEDAEAAENAKTDAQAAAQQAFSATPEGYAAIAAVVQCFATAGYKFEIDANDGGLNLVEIGG